MARARVLTYTMLLQSSKLEWIQCYESAHHAENCIVGCLILLFDKYIILNTFLGVRRAVCSTFRSPG